ncbi:hypothetical protein SFC07_01850 [Corynebacterium callunae]|uniref:hypothetical protein n=1 Tax=Corynebacterium callunae TaxID=1721 RepID=UPI003982206E
MKSATLSDMVTASMQTTADGSNRWMIYALFIVAGLFAGGAWSAYKSKNTLLMVLAGVITIAALAGGILWMIGEMT